MKKATITLSYDEEKLSALKLYLEQRSEKVEDEMTKALDNLYIKTVPANVRDFISLRCGGADISAVTNKGQTVKSRRQTEQTDKSNCKSDTQLSQP